MRPRSRGVWPQPARRRTVAIFAGNAFGDFKRASALLRRRIQRMARQAFWRFFGLRAQLQDPRHALADFSCQRLIRPAVLILNDPRRIFVLQNSAARDWLHASVTTRRRTRARTNVFAVLIVSGDQRGGR